VLVIRDNMNYQLGLCSELGVFSEWDAVSQRALIAEDLDLSEYRLVVASEDAYLSGVVERLNEYVKGGGNLLLLGGFGWEQDNFYYNGSRTEFLIEKGVNQEHIWGDLYFDVSEPEPEPSPEQEPWAIPGFPYELIVLGIAVVVLLLLMFKRKG